MELLQLIETLLKTLSADKGINTDSEVFVKNTDDEYYVIKGLTIGVEHDGVVICVER